MNNNPPLANFINKIKEKHYQPKTLVIFGSVVFALIIIISIIFIIYNSFHDKKITITNLSQYTNNIPGEEFDNIYAATYAAVEFNSDYKETEASRFTGVVRDGSFKEIYDEKTDTYDGVFIADIEEAQQSYRVYYTYTKKNKEKSGVNSMYSTSIKCLNVKDLIYPYFKCLDPYTGGDNNTIIENLLPYSGTTKSGVNVSVSGIERYYNSTKSFIRVLVDACGDKKKIEEGVTTFKDYLSSYGNNPDDYEYLTKDTCDGGGL